MLAQLLPGLRELRPPLAAGALWLVALFVGARAFGADELEVTAFEPVLDSFVELAAAVDETWGSGLLWAFSAFLVGGLSHAFLTDFLRARTRSVSAKGRRSIELVARQVVSAVFDALDFDRMTKMRVAAVDPVLVDAFDFALERERRHTGIHYWAGEDVDKDDFVLGVQDSRLLQRGPGRSRLKDFLDREVPSQVEAELRSVATRLIGKEQALFDQYDRLRAESEFRMSLVPPLAALSGVVLVAAFPWQSIVVATVVTWLVMAMVVMSPHVFARPLIWHAVRLELYLAAGAVAAFVLGGLVLFEMSAGSLFAAGASIYALFGATLAILGQGAKIQQAAGDLLADAVFVGRVESPLLERLQRAVGIGPTQPEVSRPP